MKHPIGRNGVYDDTEKTLIISIHRDFDGKSVFACDCKHPQCTGKQTAQMVLNVSSLEEAIAEYETP